MYTEHVLCRTYVHARVRPRGGTTASRDRHLIAKAISIHFKPRRRVFQGTFFLLAYVLTSSNKTFRSKTRRKPLCLYLKIADKVTDLLLRSGRTPKLSVRGNLRNT